MADFDQHIDSLLNGLDERAEFPGLMPDWNAFAQKRRRKIFWLWFVRSAAVIIPLLLAGWFLYPTTPQTADTFQPSNQTHQPVQSEVPEDTIHRPDQLVNPTSSVSPISNASIRTPSSPQPSKNVFREVSGAGMVESNTDTYQTIQVPALAVRNGLTFLSSWPVYRPDVIVPEVAFSGDEIPFGVDSLLEEGGFQLALSAGVEVVNPHLVVTQIGAQRIHKDYESIRNAAEISGASVGIHASVIRRFGRFEPGLGLGLSRLNIPGQYHFTVSESPVVDLNGTILGYRNQTPVQVIFNSDHHFTFVQVPIGLGIQLMKRPHAELIFQQRFINNVLISTSGESPHPVNLSNRESLSITNLRMASSTYMGGLQWRYKKPRYHVYMETAFSHNLGIEQTSRLTTQKLNALSIRFGLIKNL